MLLRILFMVLTFSSINAFCQKSRTATIPFYNTAEGIIKVNVLINNYPTQMIVDNGATYISIHSTLFNLLKSEGSIDDQDIKYKTKTLLANGSLADAFTINIKRLALGEFILTDVEALVVEDENAPLLIGQNVLKRFSTVTFDYINNVMSISHPLISELKLIPCDAKAKDDIRQLQSLLKSSSTLKCEYVHTETKVPTNPKVLDKLKHKLTIRYFMDVDENNANAIKRTLLLSGFDDVFVEDMTPYYDDPIPCYFEIWINNFI